MKNPTATIEYNAEPNFYTLSEIKQREPDFKRWILRNDMIASVRVYACDHGFLQLGIDYTSGKQGVGYGYRSEGNIGLMIQGLASLLGVKYIKAIRYASYSRRTGAGTSRTAPASDTSWKISSSK